MISAKGTDGISHTIHIADANDGDLSNFREFENVLDVMNLPNGSIKFHHEGEEKHIQSGRIVRSTVRGLENAFRYRCSECLVEDTDIISQSDRGETISVNCNVCEKETEHSKRGIDEL
jgi:hypothetical protein